MSITSPIFTLSVEQMALILKIKPKTMHSRQWQIKSGCPLKKSGRRLLAIEQEFLDWLSDSRKLNV